MPRERKAPFVPWIEHLPGFFLPGNWKYDAARWPDFTRDYIATRLEQIDEFPEMLQFRDWGKPDPKAWGAWLGGKAEQRELTTIWPDLQKCADTTYDTARYLYLVPAWRRAITMALTEIDDVEDQISTILWVMEWISRRVIPIPPAIMNGADKIRHTLDCAEKQLAGITPFRGSKAEFMNCHRSTTVMVTTHRTRKAQLLGWFRDNWGRLLEAAQATDQWIDVGLVLGPIMAWIEEGMWGLAWKTLDAYLIAADAVAPGYREDFERNAQELSEAVDATWQETWGSIDEWDNDTIIDQFPGFAAP